MVKAKKYVVVKTFEGAPRKDNFKVVEEELPPLKNGDILVKTEWVSVDPYLRLHPMLVNTKAPYDQVSFQVAVVQESKNSEYPVGTRVVSHKGWRDYTVINPAETLALKDGFSGVFHKIPDILGLSPSLAIGTLGMPGVSAYHSFLKICQPKSGETVVVTGAAGAVGILVGQIAKMKGCRVIGFTGSEEKVKYLENELGYDKAFNYKTVDVSAALKEAAPNGVDCYLDNVGGELSFSIISQMNRDGRVAVVGSISAYNEDFSQLPKTTNLLPLVLFKQLKIQGYQVSRDLDNWLEAIRDLALWIKTGQLKAKEHVTEGLDNVVDAFIGMLNGENYGKAVVKV